MPVYRQVKYFLPFTRKSKFEYTAFAEMISKEKRKLPMRCPNCDKRIRKDQTVCPWCGESHDAEKADNKQEGKAKRAEKVAQVQLSADGAKHRGLSPKQKKTLLIVGISLGAIVLAAVVTVVTVLSTWLGKIQRESELSEGEVAVNSDLPSSDEVQNIALFGLDSRSDNDVGRSDAVIILSIDRVHNKIKLTSIARDTYVAIDDDKSWTPDHDKLTHAWAYGKAKLAVKTLNQNFAMNITDYAYINFYEFTDLIDYLGGVMVDVDKAELNIMNNYYGPELRSLGFNYTNATTGYVRLTGPQALAYSRNRYTGSDIDRGNRQKEVLEAMFAQVKDTPLTKYPSVISQVLEMVHTTLSNDELMSIAQWVLTAKPTFEQFGLPTADCNPKSGKDAYINGVWYFIYDLDIAKQKLHDFIYEEGAQTLGTTSKTRTTGISTTSTTATSTEGDSTTSTIVTSSSSVTETDTSTSVTDTSSTTEQGDSSTTTTDDDTSTTTDDDSQSTTSSTLSETTTTLSQGTGDEE